MAEEYKTVTDHLALNLTGSGRRKRTGTVIITMRRLRMAMYIVHPTDRRNVYKTLAAVISQAEVIWKAEVG
jgi:hypothetical protein